MTQPRQPQGIPTGGQWATGQRVEPNTDLTPTYSYPPVRREIYRNLKDAPIRSGYTVWCEDGTAREVAHATSERIPMRGDLHDLTLIYTDGKVERFLPPETFVFLERPLAPFDQDAAPVRIGDPFSGINYRDAELRTNSQGFRQVTAGVDCNVRFDAILKTSLGYDRTPDVLPDGRTKKEAYRQYRSSCVEAIREGAERYYGVPVVDDPDRLIPVFTAVDPYSAPPKSSDPWSTGREEEGLTTAIQKVSSSFTSHFQFGSEPDWLKEILKDSKPPLGFKLR